LYDEKINEELSFSFPFSIGNVKDCLITTEDELRNLLDFHLTEQCGFNWESDPKIGFNENEQQQLKKRQEDEGKKFSNQISSEKLLDYCYIHDLKNIILKNWNVFSNIFSNKEKTSLFFDILSNIRNSIMHGRKNLLTHQYFLCLGICGELLLIVYRWKLGFKNKVRSYECDLKFGSIQIDDEENAKQKAFLLANQWINKILGRPSIEYETKPHGTGNRLTLKAKEGRLNIFLIPDEWCTVFNNDIYWYYTIRIETYSINMLDEILRIGGHPYWIYTITLKESLDLALLKDTFERYSGERGLSSGYYKDEKIPHSIGDVVDKFNGLAIYLKLHKGQSGGGSSIQVICDGMPGMGFYQAHRILDLKNILSLLKGEFAPIKKHSLLVKACSPITD
jgi:hypothetical protein